MPEKDTVVIDVKEYADLCCCRDRYGILIDSMLRTAQLSCNHKSFYFDDRTINTLVYSMETAIYNRHLDELIEEENKLIKEFKEDEQG